MRPLALDLLRNRRDLSDDVLDGARTGAAG